MSFYDMFDNLKSKAGLKGKEPNVRRPADSDDQEFDEFDIIRNLAEEVDAVVISDESNGTSGQRNNQQAQTPADKAASWELFKEAFKLAMHTDEMDYEVLSFGDVIKWVKSRLPKGCRRAVLVRTGSDSVPENKKKFKLHFCSVFCDDSMNILENTHWGIFHTNDIDDALKANFGDNDMIVLA